MAFSFGFYNSINHDRMYDAEQFMNLFDGILRDGVFMSVPGHFSVTPKSGMMVNVAAGRAWFNGTWSWNSTTMLVRIPDPELVYPRIDAIVLEIDKRTSVRRNRICVVKGTQAQKPAKPTLAKGPQLYQYALAYVNVKAEASEITAIDIENVVGKGETPYSTGLMDVYDVDAIWSQWEARFEEWFKKLTDSMSGNVAANLLAMIEKLTDRVVILEDAIKTFTGKGPPAASLGKNLNFYYDMGG